MKTVLAQNISKLRKEQSMTQEQLAEALGVTFASVSKWERGAAKPELHLLAEMADLFGVSIDALVGHSLNPNRMEVLIAQMEDAVSNGREEESATLCEKLLRNYPNHVRAVSACADGYYAMHVHTNEKCYIERWIEQTKRLMQLKQGEPERERLERIRRLGNQYEYLKQWDKALDYYMQSNVNGGNETAIAECLLRLGKPQEAAAKLSDALVTSVFHQFHAVNVLADVWCALGRQDKACAVLEWMYGVMESLRCNPTNMILLLIKLAGLYEDAHQMDRMKAALIKAAELANKTDNQNLDAEADFLQIDNVREMLTSVRGNRDLLLHIADKANPVYANVLKTALQQGETHENI